MRINQLRLEAFGKFTDLTLDLSAGSEGLHLVVGPNEAGKSTALAAIEQLLFGIPHRSSHAFLHPMQKLRIGGVVAHSSGRSLSFVRRKGQRETLRSADDTESIGDDSLNSFLGSVDSATFTSMFGLTWEKLQDEGHEIQKGGGEIGTLLFAAGSGIGSLRRVRDRLRVDAEKLFLPRGKKKINDAIREIEELRKELSDRAKRSQARQEIDAGIDESVARRDRLIEQLRAARQKERRLQAIRQALPLVSQRTTLDEMLAKLSSPICLSTDFRDRRFKLVSDRLHLDQRLRSLAQARDEWREKRESIRLDDRILNGAEEIESLRHDWGAIEKAARDRIDLVAEANQLAERSRQIQRETIGTQAPSWSGRDLPIVEELCQRSIELEKQREHLSEKRAGMEVRRERLKRDRESLGEAVEAGDLSERVREAEEWANIDSALEELDRRCANMREEIDRRRSSIGLDGMELAEIGRRPWPSEELVNLVDVEFQEVKRRRSEAREKLDEMESALDRVNQEIRETTFDRRLPTVEDLRESRAAREKLWREIRQAINADRFPSPTELDQFEQSYRQSDLLADRLREEADHVARLARLEVERDSLEAQIKRGKEKLAGAQAEQKEREARWEEMWSPAGLKAQPPRAMLVMLGTINAIISATHQWQEMVGERERMSAKRLSIVQSLSAAIHGEETSTRLIDVVRKARQMVEESDRRRIKQEQIERELREIDYEWREFESQQRRWEEWQAKWQKEWDGTRERLMMGEVSPTIALSWVKGERERAVVDSDRVKLLARMEGIDADAKRFAERLKPWESAGPVTVLELSRRLSVARQEMVRLQEIDQQLQRCEMDEASCRDELSRAESDGRALLLEAGTDDESLLPSLMDQSDRRREWERDRFQLEQQLAPLRHELQGELLEELVGSWTPEGLAREQEEVTRTLEEIQTEVSRLDQTLGQLRGEQSRIDGNGEGARLAELLQSKLATLERDVQQYLRLTLAGQLLDQTIEQYRRENEGPLLRRASETFCELTCGSFERLDVEFDDRSQPYLVGVRPGSTAPIDVAAMSEGTADQLYLSVRLAAVEQYVASHEPIPFLVDDILINFDDDRAAAALRVLADLSRRTQVIFFTHHAHLVEIARREIPGDSLFVHDLEPKMASDDPPPTGLPSRSKRAKRQPR